MQLSFINQGTQRGEAEKAIDIPAQDDAFNSIRAEYSDMLKNQLSKGNNGLVKHKYITFSKMCIRDRCMEVFAGGKWKPTRIEYGENWYLVGVRAEDLNGLRVRI